MRCDRCGKNTNDFSVSMFNTEHICVECKEAERKRPLYEEARKAEFEAYLKGDNNFPGIGYPKNDIGRTTEIGES